MRLQTICRACFLCVLFCVLLIGTGTASIKNTPAYKFGYHSGTINGYEKGSKNGLHEFFEYGRTSVLRAMPRPDTQLGWSNVYFAGYTDGFKEGFITGYQNKRFEGFKNNTYSNSFNGFFNPLFY
jgi:hypothetical protein